MFNIVENSKTFEKQSLAQIYTVYNAWLFRELNKCYYAAPSVDEASSKDKVAYVFKDGSVLIELNDSLH